jgi:hypothetical protein
MAENDPARLSHIWVGYQPDDICGTIPGHHNVGYRADVQPPGFARPYPDRFAMTTRDAMLKLRADALELGMREAATAYGWSALRYGPDELERELAEIVRGLSLK